MSNLQLNDTLPFGKHKGRKIEEVYKTDAAYLVWLRDTRKRENGDSTFFAPEIHPLLDDEIRSQKQLRAKYKEWGPTIAELEAQNAKADAAPPVVQIEQPAPEPEPAMQYAETWGAF